MPGFELLYQDIARKSKHSLVQVNEKERTSMITCAVYAAVRVSLEVDAVRYDGLADASRV